MIGVADPVKPASRAAIAALHEKGLAVAMITGDKRETAEAIARETGIDHVIAGVLPDGKVAALDSLRQGNKRIAFVGDGINDAPALAVAHVGIAMGSGTDVAIDSADLILVKGDLTALVRAIRLSRAVLRNIKQNLFFAFCYNCLGIPIAAGILYPFFGALLNPMIAGVIMAMSSISIVLNALRLRRLSL